MPKLSTVAVLTTCGTRSMPVMGLYVKVRFVITGIASNPKRIPVSLDPC